MELQQCINFLLNRAQQSVSQIFRDDLSEFDITPAQYAVLKVLWGQDGLSPKDLAEIIVVDRPAITGILDRLEGKNLIYRLPDATDRRALNVCLTPRAVQMEQQISKAVQKSHQHALRNFSDEEAATFISYLIRITNE